MLLKIKSELDIQRFQEDLSSVSHWSSNNNLAFSVPKFIFLHYHNKFNSLYTINGNAIPCSNSCKDLGIFFSDSLSWRLHYQNITAKAYKSFGLLHHIFKDSYCLETRKNLYVSMIRSTFKYCSCFIIILTLYSDH